MINGVEIINSHPRAVVVELFLIHKAFTILVNPNKSRLSGNHSNTGFNSGNLNAQRSRNRIHMPQVASHGLGHQESVSGMGRTTEVSHRISVNIASHQFRIRLEASGANHNGFVGFHKIRFAFVYGLDTKNLIASPHQSSGRTINKNRNIPRLYCTIKDSEETVAAFRAGNVAHRHLIYTVCTR